MRIETENGEIVDVKRNDIHRRGAFDPDKYVFFGWYYLGGRVGRNGKTEMMRCAEEIEKYLKGTDEFGIPIMDYEAMVYGNFGICGVCGARFAIGEIWRHTDSNDLVHIGCDCAEKYDLLSGTDWSALEDERRRALQARKTAARRSAKRENLFKAFPGIEDALKVEHRIIRGIAVRFDAGYTLTEAQINLVFKIAKEFTERAAKRAAEVNVPAPVGPDRQVIRGRVVSLDNRETRFGVRSVMTVKVETSEGAWLCWGTVPSGLNGVERGDEIEFSAALDAGKTPHFAFIKRPTCAKITKKAEKAVEAKAS